MKKIAVSDAVGLSICHDMTQILPGKKGPRFKRGHIITPEDVDVLLDMGKAYITVWEDEKGLVHEEDAALALAEAALGPNTEYAEPSEGKNHGRLHHLRPPQNKQRRPLPHERR